MIRNFFLTIVIFLLSGLILYTVLQNFDPLGTQRFVALFAFFLSIFCGIGSFFTLIFFFGEELIRSRQLGARTFLKAVRRGILIAIFFTVLLLLQLFRLLGIFEIVLLAIFLALVEFIFLSSRKI